MSTESYAKKGLVLCQVVALALLTTSCAKEGIPSSKEETPSFSIGTGGWDGSYRAVGLALSRIINRNQAANGFQLEYEISAGSVSNINAIVAGDSQFGIAQADHQYQAVKGLGEWRDKGPQEDLRAVFSLYTETVTLVAGGDSDIRSINDLKGKLVDIGPPGSGTRQNAIDALHAVGIDWQNDIQVHEESLEDRLSKFTHGELDAFFFTAGHPNEEVKFATFSVRGARIIPLENIDSLIATGPYFSKSSIPSGLYSMARNDVDVETIGVNATLLTSAKVSDEVVYAVTKAVFENLESLIKSDGKFEALLGDKFLEGSTAPIHAGALKYYREVGLDTPSG